jgi:hypothetical protein
MLADVIVTGVVDELPPEEVEEPPPPPPQAANAKLAATMEVRDMACRTNFMIVILFECCIWETCRKSCGRLKRIIDVMAIP